MDFGNAALLATTLFVVVELVKLLAPVVQTNKQLLAGVIIATAIADPQLVAHSDWGHSEVIKGIPLDTMSNFTLVLVGIALAGVAAVAYKLISTIPSIGENQPPDPQ